MAFCASCGAEARGNFCERCGAPLQTPEATIRLSNEEDSAHLPVNVACALCYFLWFLSGVVFLMLPAYQGNRKVRFHALQSIFFSAAYLLLVFAIGVILPWSFSQILAPVIQLGSLALWLHIMWRVYHGHDVVLPVLGDAARKQA